MVSNRPAIPILTIVRDEEPLASIVIGVRASHFIRWIADEINRYLLHISMTTLAIRTSSERISGPLLLLGNPANHPWIADAQANGTADFIGISEEGFLLKSVEVDASPALIIGGGGDAGTMYAAYELLEQLGAVFQLTGDIIPQHKTTLEIPALDIRQEPVLKYRGLHVRHFVMPEMGLQDYCGLLDHLARMKCNYLEFYWYVGSPWIEYAVRGEHKLIGDLNTPESGYTCWRSATGRFTPDHVLIGRERFTGPRACAPEFQHCRTQDEAHAAARRMLDAIIEHAHQREIQVWLGKGDCPCVPPNLGRHARYSSWSSLFGRVVSPGDPVGMDIWTAALCSMIATYPHADGYWL